MVSKNKNVLAFNIKDCERTASLQSRDKLFSIENFGEKIYAQEYYQININAGILLGMPSEDRMKEYFEESVYHAEKLLGKENIYFIKPVLYTEKDSQGQDCFLLPKFLTVVLFDKMNPLMGDENQDGSSLRIAWWQNDVGLPTEYIIKELQNLKWENPYAWSWMF